MRIGKIFGVYLKVNLLFLLLICLCALTGMLREALIVFGVTLIHEFAHVCVAKGYDLQVREIELLPFGGVARIDNIIDATPAIEINVAIAGPLNNCCMAAVAYLLQYCGVWNHELGLFFVQCNIAQALFNLLPAFPLDGGRIYRAYLAQQKGFKQATEHAVKISQIIAVLIISGGIIGIYYHKTSALLPLIGVFLFFAAAKERGMASYAIMRYLTKKKEELFRKGILPTEQFVVTEATLIRDVINHFLPEKYHTFLILDERYQIIGVLTESDVVDSLIEYGLDLPLKQIYLRKN